MVWLLECICLANLDFSIPMESILKDSTCGMAVGMHLFGKFPFI